MNTKSEIIIHEEARAFMPVLEIEQAILRFQALVNFVQKVMREGVDFGTIPGTPKPTLYKPGAEKLCTLFGLTCRFEIVHKIEDWDGHPEPLFYYQVRCKLSRGELLIAEADASCNSREGRYRWRWVQPDQVPGHLDPATLGKRGGTISEFAFAVEKGETSGQYGKPAEYWQSWRDAIAEGGARKIKRKTSKGTEMDAWEMDSTVYRIPNDDIATLVNTILKMAEKRALVAATLIAVNASEFFTQDIEDMDISEPQPLALKIDPVITSEQRTEIIRLFDARYTGGMNGLNQWLKGRLGNDLNNLTQEEAERVLAYLVRQQYREAEKAEVTG